MDTPAIQEGGCTQLPTPLGHGDRPDLEAIPISGAALVGVVAILAGVLACILQVVDATSSSGSIVALVALAMGMAGFIRSGRRWEKTLGGAACLIALAALGLAILKSSGLA